MRKKSVFYRILLADIGIVFVLIFIMIPLCNQVIRTIRERELNDSYNVMLNSINVLDSQIKNLESLLTKAYVNENLVRISIIDKEIKNSDYYAIRKGQQYVAALSSSNSYVEDIIIIFKSSGIVLTKKTSFDSIDAFNKYYNIDNFLNITNSKDPTYILSTSYNYIPEIAVTDISSESSSVSNKKIDVFCYKIPLGLPIYPKENGIAYIFINKNRLLNTALPHNFRKDGFFCLLDKNGNTILSYGTNLEL